MGLSDLLESYLEGLRVKQFGYGYRQQAEAGRLANERSRQQITMAEEEAPLRRAKLGAETEDLKARAEGRLTFDEKRQLQAENNAIKFRVAELQAAARTALAPEEKARIDAQIRELETRARLNEAKAKMPGGGSIMFSPFPATTPEGQGVLLDRRRIDPRTGGPAVIEGYMPALAPTERAALGQTEAGRQDIDLLRELVQDPDVKASIGPVAGRVTALKRDYLGGNPEKVNQAFRLAENIAEQRLRALSGAQINEQEYRRIRKLLPDPRGPLDRFMVDLELFDRELEQSLSLRFRRPGAGGPGRPAGPVPSAPSGATGEGDLIDRFLKKHSGGGVQ